MAITCSLLGHRFTGAEVEEEREEQGSEVVITIEEVEICGRCGKRRVISENKEVTSLAASDRAESAPDPDPEPDTEPDFAESSGGDTSTEPASSPDISTAEDDAELLDAGGDTTDTATAEDPGPEPDVATVSETGVGGEPTAEDDGAVIIDDDETPEREPGEWPRGEATLEDEAEPESESTGQATAEAVEKREDATAEGSGTNEWPDEYGYEEESAEESAVDWPESDDGDGEGWEPDENLTQQTDSDVEPAGTATVTVPEGSFYCSVCDFTTLVEASSLRAGDFCPSCRRGTLEHRAEDTTRKE